MSDRFIRKPELFFPYFDETITFYILLGNLHLHKVTFNKPCL